MCVCVCVRGCAWDKGREKQAFLCTLLVPPFGKTPSPNLQTGNAELRVSDFSFQNAPRGEKHTSVPRSKFKGVYCSLVGKNRNLIHPKGWLSPNFSPETET